MSRDPHRPLYHFTTDNWMNDPKPFFWDGAYHVFFQHNPVEAHWGKMHWGHAVSRDLVHWETLPIALAPSPDGPDREGCWTGCALRGEDGVFRILYTGIPQMNPLTQVQCLAESDDLITWKKHPGNPVDAVKPDGYGTCFRDPQAWRSARYGRWYMVIGGEQPDGRGGSAFLYRRIADDFTRWEYLHPLFEGSAAETGQDFECPDFFPLGGDRHVLLSSRHRTWWHVGRLDEEAMRFHREAFGPCDGGGWEGGLYAAKTLIDDTGRRILFGWITETLPKEELIARGWSGALSLPRVVTLGPDNRPRFTPAPELAALRGSHRRLENVTVRAGETLPLPPEMHADALEILIRFAPTGAARFGVHVRRSPDGQEQTTIGYDVTAKQLGDAPLTLRPGEGLTLRVFVDRSVIEAFDAEGRACRTYRAYPTRPLESVGVALFTEGSPVMAESIDVWAVRP